MYKGKQQRHPNTIEGWSVQPQDHPASGASHDVTPALQLSSKEAPGGQARSSLTPGIPKPLVLPCGSSWSPQAVAALSSDTSKQSPEYTISTDPAGCTPAASRSQFPQTSSSC